MKITRNKNSNNDDRVIRKALVFERALHSWDRWLCSVSNGRKTLRFRDLHPSLEEMRAVAMKMLAELDFPACRVFELYWLCCVFADYQTEHGFKFDKLILPDWFPFPSGLKWTAFGFDSSWSSWNLDFKGKRIFPPDVWDEADREFWFSKSPMGLYLSPENRAKCFQNYPNRDFIMILPNDHPVRKYIKQGRPTTTKRDGETLMEN